VLPGNYTIRLTSAGQVSTAPLTITLDRRAGFTPADRQAQYAAAERVKAMFVRMSKVVGEINGLREKAGEIAKSASAPALIKASAAALVDKADALRKQIVATTEGGAITGEERLREHTDEIYGAILGVEDRPTAYQLARIDALDRELKDVEKDWQAIQGSDVAAFNAKLKAANLAPLRIAEVRLDPDDIAGGGRVSALVSGLVGTHFYGDAASLQEQRERD
jgi:hypothetical protein